MTHGDFSPYRALLLYAAVWLETMRNASESLPRLEGDLFNDNHFNAPNCIVISGFIYLVPC